MAKADLEVKTLDQADFSRWDEMVIASPMGSVYSQTSYLKILSKFLNGSFQVVAVFRDGVIVGGVALFREKHRLGKIVTNRSFLYYNGIVMRSDCSMTASRSVSEQVAVLTALEAVLRKTDDLKFILHCRSSLRDLRPFLIEPWQISPSYTYVIYFSENENLNLQRMDKDQRRLIKKCEEAGVVVQESTDFSELLRLHKLLHHSKGIPLYLPESIFVSFLENLQQQQLCRLFNAKLANGKVVSSQLVLTGQHPITHTVCAATDPAYSSIGISPYLRWRTVSILSTLGFRGNDLTDAGLNSVSRFKSQLGSTLESNWVIRRPDSISLRLYHLLRHPLRNPFRTLRNNNRDLIDE